MGVSPQAAAPAPVGADRREAGIQPAGKAASADPGAGGGSASLEAGAARDHPRQERVVRRRRYGLSVTRGGIEKGTNKPKRPSNAFLLFMKGFRKDYVVPYIKVTGPMASKAGAKKWNAMDNDEKAPHIAKAEKLRAEYTKKMDEYKKSQAPYATKAKKLKTGYRSNSKSDEKGDNGESDEEDDGGESDEEDESGGSSLSEKKSKAEKGPNKPKRPKAAFLLFVEGFRKDYMEKNPTIKGEQLFCKAAGVVWKSMTKDEKAPHLKKARKLMDKYMENVKVYNNWQEAQRRPSTLDKSKSKSDLQAGGPEVPDDSDKSKSESDSQTGGPETPGDSDKSKSENDLQAGGLEAPIDTDKSKSESHFQAGGPEEPGDSDKSKSENHLQPGGPEAPDDKSKSENHLQAGGPEAPDDKSKLESDGEDAGSVVRSLHPQEASVLGGNGGRLRRQHGGLPRKLFGVARKMRKIVGCRSVQLSS